MIKITIIFAILSLASADKFSWDFYRTFASSKGDKNFVISPASLAIVLGMAKEGAQSETKTQMEAALSGTNFETLANRLSTERALKIANKMYVRQGYTLNPSYEQTVNKIYRSKPDFVNFSDSEKTAAKINEFIERETEGVLKNVVNPSSLTADTSMLLLNTIFFKGSWVHGFKLDNREGRSKRRFYLTPENFFEMNFMETDEKNFKYAESESLKLEAIELPYEGTDLKMVILLPKFQTTLREVEANLNDASVKNLLDSMKETEASVTMPKIKIESDYNLNEELKRLGMQKMFTNQAEFNFVTPTASMKVSDVHQRAFIDINEHGTIAAAATHIKFVLLCANCGPVEFTVDRPFLFLIKDSNSIYFMGRVVDPRA